MKPIEDMSDSELREILLTVDGQGKAVKGSALEELISRTFSEGYRMGEEESTGNS